MESAIKPKRNEENTLFILLLLGLLLLRFPLLILSQFNELPISKELANGIFKDGTYLITAMLIILRRNSLSEYNIDLYALILLCAAPLIRLVNEGIFFYQAGGLAVSTELWIQLIVSVCLATVLLIYRPKLKTKKIKELLLWLLITLAVGICFGVISGYVLRLQDERSVSGLVNAQLVINLFILQLTNAAVLEEPLFRGFLWGFLKNRQWKESWIWLLQAALFMVGHIYYFGTAYYSLFIVIPISALIFGLLVWRSKSIGTSMIAHGLINSIGNVVAHFTW